MTRTKATSRLLDTMLRIFSVEKIFRQKYAYGMVKVRFNKGVLLLQVRNVFMSPTLVSNASILLKAIHIEHTIVTTGKG